MGNRWGRRAAGVSAIIVVSMFGAQVGSLAQSPGLPVFGPVNVARATGTPVTRTWTFSAAAIDPSGYSVCLANGGSAGEYPPVTSARVTLNGVAVFRPNDFNPKVTSLSRQVTLRSTNTLTAEVQGQPGSGFTLTIHRGQACGGPPVGNRPPVITSIPVTSGTLLEPYAYQLTATDPDDDALSYSLTTSPAGMTIDATGAISWIPPGTGAFTIGVRAVDPSAASATQTFTLTVGRSANRAPVLTPIENRRVPAGVPFQLGLSADDPDPGDTVSFLLNSGPAGAAIAGGQAVTWMPTLANLGPHAFSVSARDSAGATATGTFTVEVIVSNGAPVLDAVENVTTPAGSLFERMLTAVDPNPGDSLTFALLSGPAGLTVSPQGALTWTPSNGQLGDHRVSVSVTDNTGLVDAGAFTVSVGVATIPQPPIARDDRYAVRIGATLTVPPPGVLANDEDPSGLPLGSTLVAGPTRGSLALNTDGAFSYTPTTPSTGGTEPMLAFFHTLTFGGATYSQPVVADLDGDARAEIVYLGVGTFATRRLVAVHGATGATYWAVNAYQPGGLPDLRLCFSFCQLSLADVDNDGTPEIFAVHSDDETARLRNRIVAFNANGSYRWTSADILDGNVVETTGMFYTTIADVDGDGTPEILALHAGKTVSTPAGVIVEDLLTTFNNDGSIRSTIRVPGKASSKRIVVADIDVDGELDIVIGGAVLSPSGVARWNIKNTIIPVVDVAVANLDGDPYAEIVYKDQFNNLSVHEHTGARKWGPIKNATLSDSSGIAIGDVDGDGLPEILVGQDGVEVWSRNGVLLMEMTLPNGLLGYGGTPTVFDLNGDGRPEVIYNGQFSPHDVFPARGGLYIFDGPTGTLLHSRFASRGGGEWPTSSPVIADVNGDGSAEIVTGSWNESVGVRVFKAANGMWSNARPVWSDQSYHVTNINADGTIPARAAINWLTPGLNNFRVQASLLPSERTGSEGDRFTYLASNGTLASNVATVGIDILPPNTAPLILSTPPANASPGLEYLYAVRAVDPDVGELITYSLPIAPVGMTVDAATGLVRWTPPMGSPASVTAVVKATDSQGQDSSQSFAITVAAPASVPDVVGQLIADAPAALGAASVTLGTVTLSPSSAPINSVTSQEPLPGTLVATGSLVDLVVSSGPAPVAVPYLVGKTELAALAMLDARGFGNAVTRVFSNSTPRGRVVAQTPAPGTPLVPGSVAITVSAGSGLILRLQRSQAPAGGALAFSAVAYDLQLIESPAPPLIYTVAAAIQPSFGTLPSVVGSSIVTAADTRGAWVLTATDATGRSTSAAFAITFPLVAGQRSMNEVFAGMSEAANDVARLTSQARNALALNDTVQMRSLLDQMVRRWRLVDVNLLHLSTPFLLPQGFYPTPADLPSLGLVPTADDLLAEAALRAVRTDLEAWTAGLRETSTSMTTLRSLADQFNRSAAHAAALRLGQWGVIKVQPLITMLLSESIPDFFSALVDELEQTVANSAGPGPGIEMSSLAELEITQAVLFIVEKALEEASPIHQVREAMLGHAAWSAAAVMAASQFREKVQGQPLTAVVAGGSLSFRIFRAPLSFIEADLDIDYPESAVVVTIGPDQVEEPEVGIGDAKEAFDSILATVRTGNELGEAMMKVYDFVRNGKANGVAEAVAGAFQGRGAGYRGCLFSSSPTCGQLVYDFGFKSVYTLQATGDFESFAGLPVPILFLVFDKSSGTVYVDLAVFLPLVLLPPPQVP